MPWHIEKRGTEWCVIKDADSSVAGCHGSEGDAQGQLSALYANEGNMALVADGTPPAWEGILTVEGVETGDGREFVPGSLTWDDPPLPLQWEKETNHGGEHQVVVNVGRIDEIWRDGPIIHGRGVFDLGHEDGVEAHRRMTDGMLSGNSVNVDQVKDADVELIFPTTMSDEASQMLAQAMGTKPELTRFHKGRIRGTTLVDYGAFTQAKLALALDSDEEFRARRKRKNVPSGHYELVSDGPWNAADHESRLAKALRLGTAHRAFAAVTNVTNGRVQKSDGRLLHHEVSNLGLPGAANITACAAAINVLAHLDLPPDQHREAYEHLAEHLRAADWVPPPYEPALVASGAETIWRPDVGAFTVPEADGPQAIWISDDDRFIHGHIARWDTCHTSFGDNVCRQAPRELSYDYFHTGEVLCADGSRVAVGQLTLGTSHPAVHGVTPAQAWEHYSNTGTAVADVVASAGKHGIWACGVIRPGTPPARVYELRAASLSGDWRPLGGRLRLMAVLAVNTPGFPLPRTSTFISNEKQLALVAAGIVTPEIAHGSIARRLADRIATRVGLDPRSRADRAFSRVHVDAVVAHGRHNQDDHGGGRIKGILDKAAKWVAEGAAIEVVRQKVKSLKGKHVEVVTPNGQRFVGEVLGGLEDDTRVGMRIRQSDGTITELLPRDLKTVTVRR